MTSTLGTDAESRLLETLLVFSAALYRTWPRPRILAAYPSLRDFQKLYRRVDQQLLRDPGVFAIDNVDELMDVVRRHSPGEIIFAIAHSGHFIAFLCAWARRGIPLAICYEDASEGYLDATARSGISMFRLDRFASPLALFAALDGARKQGRYVALMIDGRFSSRKQYDFFGYKVAASALPSIYAQRAGSILLPLIPEVASTQRLKFTLGEMFEPQRSNRTQPLLHALEAIVLRDIRQYQWVADSILLSNPIVRRNALSFLDAAATWRESHV
jgi:lauroyl/myristoyl acyltransferase